MAHHFKQLLTLIIILPVALFSQNSLTNSTILVSHECHGLKPKFTQAVESRINEGSGLVAWNGLLWTHNDSGAPLLFSIDSLSGKIVQQYQLPVKNNDWEDLSQDDQFFYLGDFGNNSHNRERLSIYRIQKQALLQNNVVLDSITFEWPVSGNFGIPEKTNFDCEAMTIIKDTIFLYTKEYKKHRCSRIFRINATVGHQVAEYVATIKTRLAITGATYSAEKKRVTLCGYNLFLSPRILSFSVTCSNDFKNICDARETRIKKSFRQVEGIASFNGADYYLISEATNLIFWKNRPLLYKVHPK